MQFAATFSVLMALPLESLFQVGFVVSLTPSLVPRSWLVQGIVSGLAAALGYALATLTSDEARALERLRAEGDVRLEQERVGWDHALSALDAHFVFCDAGDRAAGGEDADGRRIAS